MQSSRRPTADAVRGSLQNVAPLNQRELVADEGETCPVICAEEIFFGSSERKGLRVVFFSATPAQQVEPPRRQAKSA